MEKLLSFFIETLDGTTYIVVVIVAVILFMACIGYLAERSILKKKKEEQYAVASSKGAKVEDVQSTVGPSSVVMSDNQVQPTMLNTNVEPNINTNINNPQLSTSTGVNELNNTLQPPIANQPSLSSDNRIVGVPINQAATNNQFTTQNISSSNNSPVTSSVGMQATNVVSPEASTNMPIPDIVKSTPIQVDKKQ